MAGICAASFFPAAVKAAADGNPLYFILGGAAGLLPDTIDFKFYRFFYRHDIEFVPDPLNPDPNQAVQAAAWAVARAAATGKTVRLKLSTVRYSSDEWLEYSIRFNTAAGRIESAVGAIVDTSCRPIRLPANHGMKAEAILPSPVRLEYQATTIVNILDGPLLEFHPSGDSRVDIRFIPWHRQWTSQC